ncbi:hypothetical protein GCM10011352_09880 [Marinobacterium zhoushanense]|uniref:Uncharacterized protein n=1 Tax=Marinobacterium zhoushanense TaxID=1679163 RepID=A0ABQ1K410_9GAMM|nr:hypothetical protein [Marinobacterium zhoushanense]GGB86023.1 hypothetical protein GCM10011352_09880 [Marinobacterium zhoushanense]
MDITVKSVILGTAICIAGFKSVSSLFDTFAPSHGEKTIAFQQDQPTEPPYQQQIDAILQGADPSEIFEPTAAGGPRPSSECASGELELAEGLKPEMNGHTYVSVRVDRMTYIRVLPFDHTFLVQRPYQSVSATEQGEIPDDAAQLLSQAETNASRCQQRTLYLSSVN